MKPTCPMQEGFCRFRACAWWTGKMCVVMGIGIILQEFLEEIKCDSPLPEKESD